MVTTIVTIGILYLINGFLAWKLLTTPEPHV